MRIRAFKALRPPAELAAQVASEPYDAIEPADARAIAAANPYSFLHVIRAEVDLPEGTDPHDDAVYRRAAVNLRRFREQGTLVREESPCLYLYRQAVGDHAQRGVAACCRVDDYENGTIRQHEGTRPDKITDRTRLAESLNANPGPVFMAYRDSRAIDGLVAEAEQQEPLFDFAAADGVRHTGWRLADTDALENAFEAVPEFYIADGHHRSAAAARLAAERRAAGGGEHDWFPAVLFPARQLNILPYNRWITTLGRRDEEEFLAAVRQVCAVNPASAALPDRPREIGMYLGGRWHRLKLQASEREDPVSRLDVSLLQDRVLHPLLGIDNPGRDPRLEFVSGARGTAGLEQLVDSGTAAVAFTLYPVSVEEMMSVADAGLSMPPKSTWFAPKLRSGLFIHAL